MFGAVSIASSGSLVIQGNYFSAIVNALIQWKVPNMLKNSRMMTYTSVQNSFINVSGAGLTSSQRAIGTLAMLTLFNAETTLVGGLSSVLNQLAGQFQGWAADLRGSSNPEINGDDILYFFNQRTVMLNDTAGM